MAKLKTFKQMERYLKGISNHYRIEILLLIDKERDITLDGIVRKLKANEKTIGEHVRRITLAGLINKINRGSEVLHTLSPLGSSILKFLRKLE